MLLLFFLKLNRIQRLTFRGFMQTFDFLGLSVPSTPLPSLRTNCGEQTSTDRRGRTRGRWLLSSCRQWI